MTAAENAAAAAVRPNITGQLQAAQLVEDGPYEVRDLKTPTLRGWALDAFIAAYECAPVASIVYPSIAAQSGVTSVLRDLNFPEQPLFLPDLAPPAGGLAVEAGCRVLGASDVQAAFSRVTAQPEFAPPAFVAALACEAVPPSMTAAASLAVGMRPATVADYHRAFLTGATTPTAAMEAVIAFISAAQSCKPSCGWFVAWDPELIRAQAKASTARYAARKPLGLLDGVPFAVKDVADALPYPTTAGTTFIAASRPVTADSPYVSHLRRQGAILLGKTTLHEIGLGITGLNLRTGTALNPHNPGHFCGGSSSGSAAVLAAGVCPIAIGSDGGGSCRIPASWTGVVGFKPTHGRVSSAGVVEIDCTVATMGPLANTVEDLALLYTVMAIYDSGATCLDGSTPLPAVSMPSPWPRMAVTAGDQLPLTGTSMGIYWPWFNDAEPQVVACCKQAVALLEEQGASSQPVSIPELEHLRVAHGVTIASEMYHHFKSIYENSTRRRSFGKDVRLTLGITRSWTAADYVQAQCVRARATIHFQRVFEQVDVIITPTTPCTAPPIHPAALTAGESNLQLTSRAMRFVLCANFLGLPAISVPVGVDSAGLPIGLQLIGRPWQEATLLRLAAVLEAAITSAQLADTGSAALQTQIFLNPLTGQHRGLTDYSSPGTSKL